MNAIIRGDAYSIVNYHCSRKQVRMQLRKDIDGSPHTLRFGTPFFSWILDDELVTAVQFSQLAQVSLIRHCGRWYSQSILAEKENAIGLGALNRYSTP